jgi:hypothetical protein
MAGSGICRCFVSVTGKTSPTAQGCVPQSPSEKPSLLATRSCVGRDIYCQYRLDLHLRTRGACEASAQG